jgi:IclR family transcriptional regulator, acetate operon repressor
MSSSRTAQPGEPGGVQSVNRALDALELLATQRRPMSIGEIAGAAGLPTPTAHRLVRTLVERGYVRQLPDRTYALGFRLVPLGTAANQLVGIDAHSVLSDLVDEFGETATLAVLAGDQAQYVAQAPARFSMRMFTEVGRRVDLYCTGVGKALLAKLDDTQVDAVIRRRGLARHTPYTLCTETALRAELDLTRRRGYAIDEQEQELGVRCVATPLDAGPGAWMAISVSGPVTRMTDEVVSRAVPLLQAAAERLLTTLEARTGA